MAGDSAYEPLQAVGAYAVTDFMSKFWQREAYLARAAFSDFKPLFSVDELFHLATQEEVESRFILNDEKGEWTVEYGPFSSKFFKKLPSSGWTILVQGVNLWNAAADALLRRFAFLPFARLDDLMISYAVDGGGVGPHFDSYDVFLLQAYGQRRWSIGTQKDLTLLEGVPLKILKDFQPEESWVLDPGDMLYLPPKFAHDGVAVGECMTYSIGFRAPSHQEWAQGFLAFWQDELALEGVYADTGLKVTETPAVIPVDLQQHVVDVIQQKLWAQLDVNRFVGCYLTEPKHSVFFNPPSRPYGVKRFRDEILKKGMRLSEKTQMLYDQKALYCNGESCSWKDFSAEAHAVLRMFANRRYLNANDLITIANVSDVMDSYLYKGYRDGYFLIA